MHQGRALTDCATLAPLDLQNHRGVSALKQLFLKKHRIQLLEAAGLERVKGSYKCGNCSELGIPLKHVLQNVVNVILILFVCMLLK